MPEAIRTANERLRSRRGGIPAIVAAATSLIAMTAPAQAGVFDLFWRVAERRPAGYRRTDADARPRLLRRVGNRRAAAQHRGHAERIENAARDEAMALNAEIDRLKALLLSEPQVVIAWSAAGEDTPDILGDTGIIAPGAPSERVLAFGTWLEPAAAQRMQHALDELRGHGRGFVMTLTTTTGHPVEAEGRAIGGRAVLRLRDVAGIERDLLDLAARHDTLLADVETMRALLDALPAPVWARDEAGRLIFVNAAYAGAVEAANANRCGGTRTRTAR